MKKLERWLGALFVTLLVLLLPMSLAKIANAASSEDVEIAAALARVDSSLTKPPGEAYTEISKVLGETCETGMRGKRETELAIYDGILDRLVDRPHRSLRRLVAVTLVLKGTALKDMDQDDQAIVAFDKVINGGYGAADSAGLPLAVDDIRYYVVKAMITKGLILTKSNPEAAIQTLEQGLELARSARNSDMHEMIDKGLDALLEVQLAQIRVFEQDNQPQSALKLYDDLFARVAAIECFECGEYNAAEARKAKLEKIRAYRDYLLDCLAINPNGVCRGADLDKKGPFLAQSPTRAYIPEGGWGTLQVSGDPRKLAEFALDAVGGNLHTCTAGGKIRNGYYSDARDEDQNDEICRMKFVPTEGGFEVVPTEGCQKYCGARAWLNGVYLPLPSACSAARVAAVKHQFISRYQRKEYKGAADQLEPLVDTCQRYMFWTELYPILNDLAITQYHLGQLEACRKTLEPMAEAAREGDDALKARGPVAASTYIPMIKAARTNLKLCRAT